MGAMRSSGRSEWSTAFISAGAALLGAVVGVAGGLFGTSLQTGAEDRRVERTERQAAYVALISAVEAAALDLSAARPCPVPGRPQQETLELVNDRLRSIRNAAAAVYLVGSEATAAAGEGIASTADDVAVAIVTCESDPTSEVEGLYDELDEFTSLARRDLAEYS